MVYVFVDVLFVVCFLLCTIIIYMYKYNCRCLKLLHVKPNLLCISKLPFAVNRGQVFKINYVVSYRFVKISNGNITKTLLFFVEKI